MSETDNPLDARRLPFAFILAGIIILGGFGAIQTAGGPPANTCTSTSIGFCADQISFHTSVFGNSTASGIISTPFWTTNPSETILVAASVGPSFFPSQVTTVTDSLGDVFTRQIQQFYAVGSPDFNELEIWSSQVAGIAQANSVTVNWNVSVNPVLVQVVTYNGVGSIGAKSSVAGLISTGNTIIAKTVRSGVWLFGAVSEGLACGIVSTSPSFIRRIDDCACAIPPSCSSALAVETELSDNATAIRNAFSLSYSPAFGGTGSAFFEQAVIELVPLDSEPLNPDFTTFCTTTNGNCCTASNGQCVGPVTVQILFLPVISSRSATNFGVIMYATPIPYTPTSIVTSFQWLAHNSTFAFTEGGTVSPACTIAAGAFSCSIVTTFPTAFIGVPNVVATSTTPSKTLPLP